MKRNSAIAFLALLVCMLPSLALAQQGNMRLLAVSETPNGYVGGVANLHLEIREGSGRVYLETFPFTKVDTQMSTRFANSVACDYAQIDCGKYDFFYAITAKSSFIAGPSAGAAIAVLTAAMLNGEEIDEGVAITGTINAGGLIGPVGGVKEKMIAASRLGLKEVLIPKGEAFFENETQREFFDNLSREEGIVFKEVYTLDEAMFEFTGKRKPMQKQFEIAPQYSATMRVLAESLCKRTQGIEENTEGKEGALARNLTQKGEREFENGHYYAAASYCFGANVEYQKIALGGKNLSEKDLAIMQKNISAQIGNARHAIENAQIKTITDLESYMVSSERLNEAEEHVESAMRKNLSREARIVEIAWAMERLSSAWAWAEFMGTPGKEYRIDDNALGNSCTIKIAEAQERIEYLELFLPTSLTTARAELESAQSEQAQGRYALCLYKASKAKASAGLVLSVFGAKQENFLEIAQVKLAMVSDVIGKQGHEGAFPILGYSYYEYAQSLKESDVISALLYAEYALELGDLDMYFAKKEGGRIRQGVLEKAGVDVEKIVLVALGLVVGFASAYAVRLKGKKRK